MIFSNILLGQYGRQNMLRPYLKIWDWDLIFGREVNAISSLGVRSPCFRSQIILCLVILELWLLDKYSFVVFLLLRKTNLTIFKRNCFTLVLHILITIIPAAVLNRHKIIRATYSWVPNKRVYSISQFSIQLVY